MKKRGVSSVVSVVLLVLVSLALIALLVSFLYPAFKKAGSQITGACLGLTLEPKTCTYSSTTKQALVSVKRTGEDVALTKIKYIFELEGGDSITNESEKVNLLETKSFNVSIDKKPIKVSVAGVVTTESGEAKICPDSFEKVVCA